MQTRNAFVTVRYVPLYARNASGAHTTLIQESRMRFGQEPAEETQAGRLHRQLRREWRKQDEKRRKDPDVPEWYTEKVWVVYMYDFPRTKNGNRRKGSTQQWLIAGFLNHRHIKKPTIRRARRKFRIPRDILVCIKDLLEAQRSGPPGPPMRYLSTRPDVPAPVFLSGRQTKVPMILR